VRSAREREREKEKEREKERERCKETKEKKNRVVNYCAKEEQQIVPQFTLRYRCTSMMKPCASGLDALRRSHAALMHGPT
jgi:hypothetical protein